MKRQSNSDKEPVTGSATDIPSMLEHESMTAGSGGFCFLDSSVLSDLNHDTSIQSSQCENFGANSENETKTISDLKDSDAIMHLTESMTSSQSTSDGIKTDESSIISDDSIPKKSKDRNEKIDIVKNRAKYRLSSSYVLASVMLCALSIIIVFPLSQRLNRLTVKAIPNKENDISTEGKSNNSSLGDELFLQKHLSLLVYNTNQYVQCLRHERSHDQLDNCNLLLLKFTDTKFYNKTDHNLATQHWIASIENDLSKLATGIKELLLHTRDSDTRDDKTWLSWILEVTKASTSWIKAKSNNVRDEVSKSSTVVKSRFADCGNAVLDWLSSTSKKGISFVTGNRDSGKSSYKSDNSWFSWMSKKITVMNLLRREKRVDKEGTQDSLRQTKSQCSVNRDINKPYLEEDLLNNCNDHVSVTADTSDRDIHGNQQQGYQSNEQYPEKRSNDKSWLAWMYGKSKNTMNQMIRRYEENSAATQKNLKQFISRLSESGRDKSWLGWPFKKSKSTTNVVSSEKEIENDKVQQKTPAANNELPKNSHFLSRIKSYYRTQVAKARFSLNWISNKAKVYSKKAFSGSFDRT